MKTIDVGSGCSLPRKIILKKMECYFFSLTRWEVMLTFKLKRFFAIFFLNEKVKPWVILTISCNAFAFLLLSYIVPNFFTCLPRHFIEQFLYCYFKDHSTFHLYFHFPTLSPLKSHSIIDQIHCTSTLLYDIVFTIFTEKLSHFVAHTKSLHLYRPRKTYSLLDPFPSRLILYIAYWASSCKPG